jgi:hypothetical protein
LLLVVDPALLSQLPKLPEQYYRHDDFQETRNPALLGEGQDRVHGQNKTQYRDTNVRHPEIHGASPLA